VEKYHKIQTVYKRDPKTKHKSLLIGEYSLPEFEFLAQNNWVGTEKIDGMNIRVMWDGADVEFGGRTDKAHIPVTLISKLQSSVYSLSDWQGMPPMCLYGEGYGARIQKGGGDYIPDGVDFILFDVRCGGFWLKREDVKGIAEKFGLKVAPIVFHGLLEDAVKLAEIGFESQLRTTPPEGMVLTPAVPLLTRAGERIITKIKLKDFEHAK
jgi:hypothetical protein